MMIIISYVVGALLLLLALPMLNVANSQLDDPLGLLPRRFLDSGSQGTKWAVLVAGSNGYENYRHQADVCHAYQILKNGGLKDENIIVFMYDDIAQNSENPKRGVIVNKPHGKDVYKGVPKDYVKHQVTANNFYAVILGNKTALTGGSGKVVDSGPNDHIFIFYSDHGAAGILGMPEGPYIMANDLINVLKKKHASRTYKNLVFYLEACEAGSIFEGLLPNGMNIYATTASNATENSWASYCESEDEYGTCLGDLYSVSWMEDSEEHNLETETLRQQYQGVKKRTKLGNADGTSSNVMQYGDIKLSVKTLSMYMGAKSSKTYQNYTSFTSSTMPVNQRDADLFHFWHKFKKSPQGSIKKAEARKELVEAMAHRMHVDSSVGLIGNLLFGIENGPKMMAYVRPAGQPVVDDWDCLKSTVRTYETYCGSLTQYGIKHMRSFANICNAEVKTEQMAKASAKACPSLPSNSWSSLKRGFSV